ncbi:MAG: epoxyqueuosine reductase QueH [Bacilli bacterium]|nr:epoxyqueuosine reductase QueH [Bacilli bacterium]
MNKLLLHSCCAPCGASVIEKLKPDFSLTVLFYNPNIEPFAEYTKRKDEQIKLLKKLNINYLEIDYLNDEFKNKVKGFEKEKEGGKRCELCYKLRLEKTAKLAKINNFDYFTTTLTVSPYKNSKIINEIGKSLEAKYQIKYLISDFKKEDGYKKSIELSKRYNLYRQNYCGCLYGKGLDEK